MNKNVIIPYLKKYKFYYIVGIITLFLVDYFNLYVPRYIGDIVDGLTDHILDINGVFNILLHLAIVILSVAIGRILWRVFIFGAARKVENGIRNDMFKKLETLSQNYFNEHKTGDLMAHFTNDLEALRMAIGPAIVTSFDAIVMTTLVLYQMIFNIDFKLTIMVLIPMSTIAIGSIYCEGEFEKRFANKQRSFAKLSDKVQEAITGERVIKAFTQEELQAKSFDETNKENLAVNMRVIKLMATFQPTLEFVIGLTYVVAIIYGGYLSLNNVISVGQFIAFNQYLAMLVWPMIAFGDSITMVSQGRAAISRINQIFKEIPDTKDAEDALEVNELKGNIKLEHLTFTYGEEFENALTDINLEIKQGETLALLGRTGEGKTTLVNLLLRLYDATSGKIYLDEHEIKELSLDSIRSNISFVPQDSYLFSDTITNNVRFGKRDASQAEVEKMCEIACVHDNIIDFPMKYDTVVGERGVTLSGGQKQRISIARALLKDSAILILDDALSAVDTDTEDKILANLKEMRKDKTTIMIAHRISTVKNADHILVLDGSRVKEYGTFDELMALNGEFKEMYDKQQLEKQLSME